MPSINSGSTAQQMYVSSETREAFSLDRNNCITHSSDNASSMIGHHNSLLKKLWSVQGGQKIFEVGYPSHLAHVCAGNGANELSVNVEDLVIDIYHNFCRSAKLKNSWGASWTLKIRKVINHNSASWLSLRKCFRENIDAMGLFGIIFSV